MYATLSFPSFFPILSQNVITTSSFTLGHTISYSTRIPKIANQCARVSSTRCWARRQIRYDEDEDENDQEYGHNEEIAMLEFYSQIAQEALLVKALVDDQEVEVLIFKGFSSSLSSGTPPDPTQSILPARAVIKLMDLFGLIKNPNPKVKVGTRPRAAHEVPLLQATASRVVTMEETLTILTSTGTPSAMEKSPLDFANEDVQMDVVGEHQTDNPVLTTDPQQEHPAAESAATKVPPETNLEQEVLTMGPPVNKRRRKRDRAEAGSSAPSKVPRTERDTTADTQSVNEPEPLSFAVSRPTPEPDVAQSSKAAAVEDEDTEKSSSFISMGGPPDDIYQPNWGITNSCRLDNPLVCQELVALGSQLRLRFEQESKLLKKSVAKIGRREQKIQVQDDKIRNLESLIEAESDMKRAAEAKNETLTKELEDLRAHFSKLQVDSEQLTQQVATLQAQVTGEEKIKAAFKEFKQLEEKRVEQRCAEMDARLDALSIDFDEELYPHMLTAIAGH
ncbi:hypothetical protein Tco_1394530 [Tanacetum coccineum]